MSVPMRFEIFSKTGEYLCWARFMTRSYGSKAGDLTKLIRRYREHEDFARYIRGSEHRSAKYIVCTEAPDYMVDIDTLALLPNKFGLHNHWE